MSNYIQKLIEEGEHQMLDFKFEISDSKKIARTLVAFANTDGGRLLIGVKDNGSISGIRSEEEKYMIQTAAEMYCQPVVDFEAKEWNVNGKTVLEVIVPKSKYHKHRAPDHNNLYKVYTRVKDQNILADGILLKIWKYQNNKQNIRVTFSDAEMFLLKYLNENERITIKEFVQKAEINRREAERIIVNFTVINMLKYEITEKEVYFTLFEENC
ncbi:MAG: ATP-binding protein [Bacteroidales bacterium]|nr:ATP-binding protein [Bacteroidales bacterium]